MRAIGPERRVSLARLPSMAPLYGAMDDRFLVLADYVSVVVISLRDFAIVYSTAIPHTTLRQVRIVVLCL